MSAYKDHANFIEWCNLRGLKPDEEDPNYGMMTLNQWVHGFRKDGAKGEFSILSDTGVKESGHHVVLFAYELPATADQLAEAFGQGLAALVDDGWVAYPTRRRARSAMKRAPRGNTGLTSQPQAN